MTTTTTTTRTTRIPTTTTTAFARSRVDSVPSRQRQLRQRQRRRKSARVSATKGIVSVAMVALVLLVGLLLAPSSSPLPAAVEAAAFSTSTSPSPYLVGGGRRRAVSSSSSSSTSPTTTRLFATTTTASTNGAVTAPTESKPKPPISESRRKELLTRRGPHFRLDRSTGKIEFGAVVRLVTQLEEKSKAHHDEEEINNSQLSISEWLHDESSLAASIWDERLTTHLGHSVYRLQVMTLQFVTLKLSPWVDLEMKTRVTSKSGMPVFCLASVGFDPNVELLPGMKFSTESLGIVIDVAGQLHPTQDGTGVTGAVAFETSGILPPPMRLLPDGVLKNACDAINDTVVKFACQSFERGAGEKYRKAKMMKAAETAKADADAEEVHATTEKAPAREKQPVA